MNKPSTLRPFTSFGFSSSLLNSIKRAGYIDPTTVQSKAIPEIVQGHDVLVGAETDSGKTAAFALPLLEKLMAQKKEEGDYAAKANHIRALILVPTRELAIQISDEITAYAEGLTPRIKSISVFGGVKINPQMMALRGGADVLVGTPGRLLDLYSQNAIKFNKLRTLIIDEVDRLVGEGFKEEIEAVFRLLPNARQNLMFTATYPDSIRYLIRRLLKQPVIINISASDDSLIDQRVFTTNRENKNSLLAHLLDTYDWKQILVFCSAKRSCDNLVKKLETRGITAVAMHGNKEQRARAKALREFKNGTTRVLIATDVAARGLDIESLPCVINFELPRSPKDYIHRIGRTGRAGETGFAISLIAHDEYAHFSVIEKHVSVELEREQVEGFEADETAPPPPKRAQPKKKARKKISKKKKARLQEQKVKSEKEASIPPQKIKADQPVEESPTNKPVMPSTDSQKIESPYKKSAPKNKVAGSTPPRKSQVAAGTIYQQQTSKPRTERKTPSPERAKKPEQTKIKEAKVPKAQAKPAKNSNSSGNASIWGAAIKRKETDS